MNSREEFETIYKQEVDPVFRFALFRVSDRERALDITQEAFTRLWQMLARGDKLDNPRGFLYHTTRNLIIDWYRRKKSVSLEAIFEDEDSGEVQVTEPEAPSLEIGAEVREALEKLESLPEDFREVIYLRFVEGRKPQEIGELLELSPNIVSVRITRGIKLLRKIMGIEDKDE